MFSGPSGPISIVGRKDPHALTPIEIAIKITNVIIPLRFLLLKAVALSVIER